MFVPFTSLKGEEMWINTSTVLFFTEGKKGTVLVFDDYFSLEVAEDIKVVKNRLITEKD